MNTRYHFAYGSNLNTADWQGFCEKRNWRKDLLRFHSRACLPDHDVAFSYDSTRRCGGALDIIPRVGQVVPGVIFEVDEEGWEALDQKEGAPACYERTQLIAIDDRRQEVPVTTYRVVEHRRQPYVRPRSDYVRIVREGLEAYELPTAAMLAAAEGRISPLLIDAFFVYGTLLRGESRFNVLRPFGPACILLARTFGRLVHLGGFPGLIDLAEDEQMVEGEFVRMADVAGAIRALDQIEGFCGYSTGDSLFRRTILIVDVGEGRIRRAWTYRYARDPREAQGIPSGDWRRHVGRRESFGLPFLAGRRCDTHCCDDPASIAEMRLLQPPLPEG